MDGFTKAQQVEARGMADLMPFLLKESYEGRAVLIEKGSRAEELQRSVGDILMTHKNGQLLSLEIKCEAKDSHGNFFLEEWSNLNFERRRPGWMKTLRCDLLLYYFVESGELYIIKFKSLWEWMYGTAESDGCFSRFPLKKQSRYDQKNLTAGRCVPITEVFQAVGFKYFVKVSGGFQETEYVSASHSKLQLPSN